MNTLVTQESTALKLWEQFPKFLVIHSDEYREELIGELVCETYTATLAHYSESIFNDNIWVVVTHEGRRRCKIDFEKLDLNEHELRLLKCFCVENISAFSSADTARKHLSNSLYLFRFLRERNLTLGALSSALLESFVRWLKSTEKVDAFKQNDILRSIEKLVLFMKAHELLVPRRTAMPRREKLPPSKRVEAPEREVMIALDRYFFDFGKPVSTDIRLAYMLLRIIPNRISEVLDISISRCRIDDELFAIEIPTRKETAMHKAKYKHFSFFKTGAVENLVLQALEEQLKYAQETQNQVQNTDKGFLMVSRTHPHRLLQGFEFNSELKKVIQTLGLTDSYGQDAHITSHDLRHAIISDYLAGNVSLEEVQKMAGHIIPADTMGYGAPARADAIRYDRKIKRELLGSNQGASAQFDAPKEPRAISANRFDTLKGSAQTRLLDEGALCVQTNCSPQYAHCFTCDNFTPDPSCVPLIESHCLTLEQRIVSMRSREQDALLDFNKGQLDLFQGFLNRAKGAN